MRKAPDPETPDPCNGFGGGSSGDQEPGPGCDISVITTKGPKITDYTPEVGLVFPASGNNTIGPASWGLDPNGHLVTNGYYWNTYIYAQLRGKKGVWTARQSGTRDSSGTFWDGSNPKSVYALEPEHEVLTPDRESPRQQFQYNVYPILAWTIPSHVSCFSSEVLANSSIITQDLRRPQVGLSREVTRRGRTSVL